MSFVDILLGKPLATSDERAEQIGPIAGIPIFGLDALSSAAYGPEAALTLLIPLGAAGVAYIVPVSASIIVLLAIVYFSYRQTIAAYPGGGGSYTVASENLGTYPGPAGRGGADAGLRADRGGGNFRRRGRAGFRRAATSAAHAGDVPGHPRVVTIVNLRGVREAGVFFMIPTYAFLGSLLIAICIGVTKTVFAAGHPVPVVAAACERRPGPAIRCCEHVAASASVFQRLHGDDRGRGGQQRRASAFREPTVRNAQRTLTVIIALLAILLAGIAYLVRAYGIQATDPGQPGYQSVISMLVAAVAGRGMFYYFTIGSVLLILSLSANTAFADFPRLCKAVAHDGFLPHSFGFRGRRLVYSQGIYVLAVLCGNIADHISRRNGPADSALRDRRVSGVHAVAGGDGGPLAAEPGPRRAVAACSSTGWERWPRASRSSSCSLRNLLRARGSACC